MNTQLETKSRWVKRPKVKNKCCIVLSAICPGHCSLFQTPGNVGEMRDLLNLSLEPDQTCLASIPGRPSVNEARCTESGYLWPYHPKWVTLILFMEFWFLHTFKEHLFSFQMIPKLCKSAYRFKSYWWINLATVESSILTNWAEKICFLHNSITAVTI